MKPIAKQPHYSIVIMRDDGAVRSFRMKGSLIRACAILFLCIIFSGIAGAGAGFHYWKRFRIFMTEFRENEQTLSELKREVADLRNLKAVIEAQSGTELPLPKNEEVGIAEDGPVWTPAGSLVQGNTTLRMPQDFEETNTSNSTQENIPEEDPAVESSNLQRISSDSVTMVQSIGKSPIQINTFSARPSGGQGIRIQYELSVSPSSGSAGRVPISGTTRYTGFFSNGTHVELSLLDPHSARFSISRMKPMTASSRLPQGFLPNNLEEIAVTIETSQGIIHRERFPFE